MPESMLDADQNCFATGHRPKRVWGRTKVLTFGGQAVSQNYDQYGNLEFGDHPYSLDACQLAKTANARPSGKNKGFTGGQNKVKLLIDPHGDDAVLFASFTVMRERPLVLVVFD